MSGILLARRGTLLGARRKPMPPGAPAAGDSYLGGYYVGLIDTTVGNIDPADASPTGARFALIVAAKSTEITRAWKTANTAGPLGVRTRWDGLSSTTAMASTAYPAAYYCYGLSYPSDGASRWYLPAMDELELLYRVFKPYTTLNVTGSDSGAFPSAANAYGYNPSSDPPGAAYTSTSPAQTPVAAFQHLAAQAIEADYYISSTEADTGAAWGMTPYSTSGTEAQYTKNYTGFTVRPVRRLVLT